jgi:hypothetical protein
MEVFNKELYAMVKASKVVTKNVNGEETTNVWISSIHQVVVRRMRTIITQSG